MKILPRAVVVPLAVCLAAAFLVPRSASADDSRAAALAMFDEAMKRMEAHAYDRACPQLEDVVKLQPGKVGAMLELGRCYEEWGKTASAWSGYRAAAEAAAAAADARATNARAQADELGPRVPKLTIAVAPANRDARGFTVQRDAHELGAVQWDTALPADPGKHVVVASAPGKKRWTGDVTVPPRAGTTTISVPALEDDAEAPAAPAPTTPEPPSATAGGGAPVWPWAVGGAGVVMLSIGVGFGADGIVASSSLNQLCNGTLSPCAGHTENDIAPLNARKDRGLGLFLAFGPAGAAGVVAAIVGFASQPKQAEALVVTPWLGPGLAGVGFGGKF